MAKRIRREAAMGLMTEYNLLLDEVERMLEEKLIAVYLVRTQADKSPPSDGDLAGILELAIRLLKPKKNRSIKEAAILAYAEKRLRELAEGK